MLSDFFMKVLTLSSIVISEFTLKLHYLFSSECTPFILTGHGRILVLFLSQVFGRSSQKRGNTSSRLEKINLTEHTGGRNLSQQDPLALFSFLFQLVGQNWPRVGLHFRIYTSGKLEKYESDGSHWQECLVKIEPTSSSSSISNWLNKTSQGKDQWITLQEGRKTTNLTDHAGIKWGLRVLSRLNPRHLHFHLPTGWTELPRGRITLQTDQKIVNLTDDTNLRVALVVPSSNCSDCSFHKEDETFYDRTWGREYWNTSNVTN